LAGKWRVFAIIASLLCKSYRRVMGLDSGQPTIKEIILPLAENSFTKLWTWPFQLLR
jgi:hypothetical protein